MSIGDTFPRGKVAVGATLTTQVSLLPKLRINGSMHPLPLSPFLLQRFVYKIFLICTSIFITILNSCTINKIVQEFKIVIKKGLQLNNRKLVNTILLVHADDQILMATSEDELLTMA